MCISEFTTFTLCNHTTKTPHYCHASSFQNNIPCPNWHVQPLYFLHYIPQRCAGCESEVRVTQERVAKENIGKWMDDVVHASPSASTTREFDDGRVRPEVRFPCRGDDDVDGGEMNYSARYSDRQVAYIQQQNYPNACTQQDQNRHGYILGADDMNTIRRNMQPQQNRHITSQHPHRLQHLPNDNNHPLSNPNTRYQSRGESPYIPVYSHNDYDNRDREAIYRNRVSANNPFVTTQFPSHDNPFVQPHQSYNNFFTPTRLGCNDQRGGYAMYHAPFDQNVQAQQQEQQRQQQHDGDGENQQMRRDEYTDTAETRYITLDPACAPVLSPPAATVTMPKDNSHTARETNRKRTASHDRRAKSISPD
jgi:hypothetical protein